MQRIVQRGTVLCATLGLGIASIVGFQTPSVRAAEPTTLNCGTWRYGPSDEPSSLPPEFDRNDYKRTSLRDPALQDSPQNLCGQMGSAVDLAWGISQGNPNVVIAVLDSGIRWRSTDTMADLATQVHINLAEAHPPCYPATPTGDCNADGVFNITDFGPLADRNANGLADPEDLILDPAYSNGTDDDHNGYIDDIAGWDFLSGDNDPLDTVDYGHGSGEAKDSVAAANGTGSVGTCPKCQFLPVRVGDSFIADGQRLAAGALFALDSGARVIQEALGVINNPSQAQAAIDAAYRRDVVVVASMADEASKHPNLPGALEHTLAVNSVTRMKTGLLQDGATTGYLALNGCTNFGGRTFVSVPSSSCSSEATGIMSGIVGLIESTADQYGINLSANEVMQIVRTTADDIDFSSPNAHDPANNFGTPSGNPLVDTVRYPSRAGWDATFGYGRVNAYEMLKAIRDGAIAPEAMIDGPKWFSLEDTSGSVAVTGHVGAPRATNYDYDVQWTTGLQPPAYPATDTWHSLGGGTGLTGPRDGTLATLNLADVAAQLPDNGQGTPVDASNQNRPDEERFTVRLRVKVRAHGGTSDGLTGEMQKQIFVHHDPDLVAGFPRAVAGTSSASSRFVDVDGDGTNELLVATSQGTIHAYRANGTELSGFPVSGDPSTFWPTGSSVALRDHIAQPAGAFLLGAPAVGDLDGDGQNEIVDADLNGKVYVWSRSGQRLATMTTNPAYARDAITTQDEYNRTQSGFASAPALGDLDGDGTLEIVAAAMDRHVYAWHANGTPVAGFPVLAVDPQTPAAVDPASHHVTFKSTSNVREGGSLIATPTLADLDGDGHPDIIVGAQEEYVGAPQIGGDGTDMVNLIQAAATPGTSRVYAISSKGTLAGSPPAGSVNPDAGAYLPGWPVHVPMLQTEALPTIGDGVAMPAIAADFVPTKPGIEVAMASATGTLMVFGADGTGAYGATSDGPIPPIWAAGVGGPRATTFGAQRNSQDIAATMVAFAGPSAGDLTGDGLPDYAVPALGLSRMLDINLNDLQIPNDDQVIAYNGTNGSMLPGFPQTTSDMAFFVQSAIGNVGGSAAPEVIAGNGVYTLNAFDASGASPANWPKLTGGWTVGTPAIGDWDGDGKMEVAQLRRDGQVMVWHTDSTTTPQWSSWNCDPANTGSLTAHCAQAKATQPSSATTTTMGSTSTSAVRPGSTAGPSSTMRSAAQPAANGAPPAGTSGDGSLPFTGARIALIALIGGGLVGAGVVIELARRKRKHATKP